MPHEFLKQNAHDLQGPSNKNFGLTFATLFLVFSLWPLLFGSHPRLWAMVLAAIFLLLALVHPSTLTLPNRLWLKFGLLLQAIISPVALAILFYVVFTPIGLLIRVVFRKILLVSSFDHHAKSYWICRNPPGPAPDSLTNQF